MMEDGPFPIETVEVTDVEMAQLALDYIAASDKTPYVVSNVQDPNNKTYYEWTGSEWINWIGGGGTIGAGWCLADAAVLTPPEITTDQDDYEPAGFTDGSGNIIITFLRLDASSGMVEITGLKAPSTNKYVIIFATNIGSDDIKFKNNSGSSIAANRFLLAAGERKIKSEETKAFIYDHPRQRWIDLWRH